MEGRAELRILLAIKELTVREGSEEIGVHYNTLRHYLKGTVPKNEVMKKIQDYKDSSGVIFMGNIVRIGEASTQERRVIEDYIRSIERAVRKLKRYIHN